ncbi:hypothetical protein GGX14DRAFT_407173, partial [Mycena pura]
PLLEKFKKKSVPDNTWRCISYVSTILLEVLEWVWKARATQEGEINKCKETFCWPGVPVPTTREPRERSISCTGSGQNACIYFAKLREPPLGIGPYRIRLRPYLVRHIRHTGVPYPYPYRDAGGSYDTSTNSTSASSSAIFLRTSPAGEDRAAVLRPKELWGHGYYGTTVCRMCRTTAVAVYGMGSLELGV